MPLLNGRPVKFIPHPTDIPLDAKVFQIRYTGEIFKTYEEYSARLDFYRQPKFSCKYTGKSGFNYENAVGHENQIKLNIFDQIPEPYLSIILKETQYAQLKLSDLVTKIYEKCILEYNEQNNIEPPKEENTDNSNPETKKKPTKTPKYPFKKSLIRTQIRVAADRQNFNKAPWILHREVAEKYNISTEIPQNLKLLIEEYLKNKDKIKQKKSKPKKKKEKSQKKEKSEKSKSVKPVSMIHSLTIKSPKSLKYPCDDQLLLMYDRMDNEKLIAFDQFWHKIQKIGFNVSNHQNADDESQVNNYSNLAFIDYNTIYDGNNNGDVDMTDNHTKLLKHRQLNDLFNEIWKLWSFIQVYHQQLDVTPFPISFLIDALCYDKRCSLLDELQCCLLEMIRKHCISTIAERIQQKKDEQLKQIKARKKQQKYNKKKQEKRKQRQQNKRSDKEEMDASDDEEDEAEDTEESEEEEESEVTESEEDDEEESESDDDEDDDEDEDIDIIDIEPPQWDENAIFTNEPITFFKLDILREYLHFRCIPKIQPIQPIDTMDIDEDKEDEDINMNDKEDEELEKEQPLLPQYEYLLHDEIWDHLSNIRSYVTLPIESKLEIFKILFQDAMSTNFMMEITNQRIEKYQDFKQEIKTLDDEYSQMVKTEKRKLREIRNELILKKRVLNPKKEKKAGSTKTKQAGSSSSAASSASSSSTSSSSVSGSASPSKSISNSPNKENNASKANSKSRSNSEKPRITSRQEKLLKKKEEKARELREREEELLREKEYKQRQQLIREVNKMEDAFKMARDLMTAKLKEKELSITYKKRQLFAQCSTYFTELGSDRFYNKYFWSIYSDGRIFIYHSNPIYHQLEDSKTGSIIKDIMTLNENDMKCYNEWEQMMDSEHRFCWSFISTTTEFYNLLNILDERGVREAELLLNLKAFKKDIIASMKLVGNDDYVEPMSVDMRSESPATTTEDVPMLRRSKRVTRSLSSGRTRNSVPPHIQFANKGFLSYKNTMKQK